MTPGGPLADLRVVELAGEQGQWCGRLLADLGADVVKIEPPGGAPERRFGPYYQDEPHPDRSLSFWHYNSGKRAITLDIESAEGATVLRRLVAGADVFLETQPPGRLAALGLGPDELRGAEPRLIYCSLTPFGQDGPWRDFQTTDLVQLAAGGQMAQCGYDEEDDPD
ncbi:MAG: CoA transferase, partial [Chloroflexi bacterium]|nr:CoA transferase [Chloroflexota bacterium]